MRGAPLNDDAERDGLPAFRIGIGVNTGDRGGGHRRRRGAARLHGAWRCGQRGPAPTERGWGGEILSAATVRQTGTDRTELVGMKRLKGRRTRWRPTGSDGRPPPPRGTPEKRHTPNNSNVRLTGKIGATPYTHPVRALKTGGRGRIRAEDERGKGGSRGDQRGGEPPAQPVSSEAGRPAIDRSHANALPHRLSAACPRWSPHRHLTSPIAHAWTTVPGQGQAGATSPGRWRGSSGAERGANPLLMPLSVPSLQVAPALKGITRQR
jgi:hypothetical protein